MILQIPLYITNYRIKQKKVDNEERSFGLSMENYETLEEDETLSHNYSDHNYFIYYLYQYLLQSEVCL